MNALPSETQQQCEIMAERSGASCNEGSWGPAWKLCNEKQGWGG